MTKLEPTEAQRDLMIQAILDNSGFGPKSAARIVDAQIAAVNSIPEGPPVGTIARRPDGAWKAERVQRRVRGPLWEYSVGAFWAPGAPHHANDAGSWPVIYDPREGESLPQAEPCQSIDPVSELKCSQTLGHEGNHGTCSGLEWPDPTAQQEPEACESCHGSGVGLGKVLGGFLETDCSDCDATGAQQKPPLSPREYAASVTQRPEPQQEPERGTSEAFEAAKRAVRSRSEGDTCPFTAKPRTPRVVDRLGVDEQGSRWRDRDGDEWRYRNGWRWRERPDIWAIGNPSPQHAPYTEIVRPRVLPSLDCEEARDGTVWQARYALIGDREQTPGWKFRHTADGWVYEDDGTRVMSPEFLTDRCPYTEVLS